MKLKISYRHMDASPALGEYIKSITSSLGKYFQSRVDIHVKIGVEGGKFFCDITAHTNDHHFYHSHDKELTAHKAVSFALKKIEKQIKKEARKKVRGHIDIKDYNYSSESA